MRPASALFVTVALVAAALYVPATAHADVTNIRVTGTFDRLDPDRVATVSVSAKSASGVTDVRANVRHPSPQGEVHTTLQFERVDGTENDGTWRTQFHPDVEAHPGANTLELLITSADGETVTRFTSFVDCYETSITDVTISPKVIDEDRPEVDVRGRVMVQKSRDVAPVPVPGAVVQGRGQHVTTGTDGSFRTTIDGHYPLHVRMLQQGTLCAAAASHRAPTIVKQATETSARMTTPQPIATGTEVSVQGKVLRHGAAGLVPAAGVPVRAHLNYGTSKQRVLKTGYTAEDGTFQLSPVPDESGPLTVVAQDTAFLTGSNAPAGTVDVRKAVRFTTVNADPEPGQYGGYLRIRGRLVGDLNGLTYGLGNVPVIVEFSTNGTAWTHVVTRETFSDGTFEIHTNATTKDGYWRVRYAGSAEYLPAVSGSDHVDVKYRTHIHSYDVSPEPVPKGHDVTVKGLLYRYTAQGGIPGPGANVHIYFQPTGSSEWTWMGAAKTASNGWFSKKFTASKTGTWLARYWGSDTYLGSNLPTDTVEVGYRTYLYAFNASPEPVTKGADIRVVGLLHRFRPGGIPAPGVNIHIYFKPNGSSKWTWMGAGKTGSNGWFSKKFKASQDGTWLGRYWGNGTYLGSNLPTDYVDVR